MYYEIKDRKVVSVSSVFDPGKHQMADTRNIPKDNCELVDGQLYDNRELDYWKLAKAKENQLSAYMKSIAGVVVDGIKIKTTAESITALNELLSFGKLKGEVEFRDFNDDWHTVMVAQFENICLKVGEYGVAIDKTYTTNIKLIDNAETIEELKAIVI